MSNGKQSPLSLYFVDEASPEGLGITLEQYRQLIKEVRPTMSTKREPLLSNEALEFLMANHTPEQIRDILALYEWTRAKDAELIQHLVDALKRCDELYSHGAARAYEAAQLGLKAATAAGFKPTEP